MGRFKGTPGSWRWELNEKSNDLTLCGGKPMYDLTVMDFVRWGMGGAIPRFNTQYNSDLAIMEKADTFGQIVPERKHHAAWFKILSHPDAQLIAAAPDLLEALKDLWFRSTNLFGELTIDEIKADDCLQGLSISIDNAKAVIRKALREDQP